MGEKHVFFLITGLFDICFNYLWFQMLGPMCVTKNTCSRLISINLLLFDLHWI